MSRLSTENLIEIIRGGEGGAGASVPMSSVKFSLNQMEIIREIFPKDIGKYA
jgi:hypothetical protein